MYLLESFKLTQRPCSIFDSKYDRSKTRKTDSKVGRLRSTLKASRKTYYFSRRLPKLIQKALQN